MTERELPLLRVESLDDALDPAVLARLAREELERFLLGRRWFGAKGRRASSLRVAGVVPLVDDGYRAAVARLEVEFGNETHVYQLPLATRRDDAEGAPPKAILALLEARDATGVLFDAAEDPGFRSVVAASFAQGRAFGTSDARWVVEPVAGVEPRIDGRVASRISSGEQSNTSIVYGDAAILKLFRRLEAGENPDVEIGRFLTTRTSFRNTPTLLGTIAFEDRRERRTVAGMLQSYVAGSIDAWRDTLERARAWFAARDDGENEFLHDARELGRVTRALHDALASDPADPDFAPEPASAEDVAGWSEATRRSIDRATALLADRLDAGAVHEDARTDARTIVERREAFHDAVADQAASLAHDAGERIRHHGDYHLGQVLRAPEGTFMIIDFEGEPARSLAERRQRASALRDVAGMLRSFAYAAATLATEQRSRAGAHGAALDRRAERWEHDVRAAYLRGYLHEPMPRYLPSSREHVDALLALFETEKVFYELSYELNNRPDWVWIPIQGITRLLAAHATHLDARR